jgi:hypothetical protein
MAEPSQPRPKPRRPDEKITVKTKPPLKILTLPHTRDAK